MIFESHMPSPFYLIIVVVVQITAKKSIDCPVSSAYRSFDGSCNNQLHPSWGAVDQCLRRVLSPDYGADPNGYNSVRQAKSGGQLPNARDLSNDYCKDNHHNDAVHSHLVMQFGLLITLDSSSSVKPMSRDPNHVQFDVVAYPSPCCTFEEPIPQRCDPISVRKNDSSYGRFNVTCLNKFRTDECESPSEKRQQQNRKSSYLDMTGLYGVTSESNRQLRLFRGGRLKRSRDANGRCVLLPRSRKDPDTEKEPGEACSPYYDGICFLAGGPPNLQPLLTVAQTILMRQHNRLAKALEKINPHWNDEKLFQEARRIFIAQYQSIIYGGYLSLILGPDYMNRYRLGLASAGQWTDYDETVNAGLTNEFSTAAYRFGHSEVQGRFMMVKANGKKSYLRLKDYYFHPKVIYEGYLGDMLRGMVKQPMAAVDPNFVDDIRDHLYKPFDKKIGLDLISLNIQRGRDHGIRGYVEYLRHCDGAVIKEFKNFDKYMDKYRWEHLEKLYEDVQDIDLYLGGLSERPVRGGVVGPTLACIIGQQFADLKFGDRFYFEHRNQIGSFTKEQLKALRNQHLASIICRNEKNFGLIQERAFSLPSKDNPLKNCNENYDLVQDISLWKD